MTLPIIHHGDCLEVLRTFPDNSFDGLLSDPPAGIGFMGKAWDRDKGGRDQWIAWLASVMREAHRVLKPGAFGLVWALPRTAHWTTMALEDAGFEVRDVVVHLFGSGFPKSLDVSKAIDAANGEVREVREVRVGPRPGTHGGGGSYGHGNDRSITAPATDLARQWEGYGTALKPAAEHWILVRKPLDGTVAANAAKWGTGGIAIDACRIDYASDGDMAAAAAAAAAQRVYREDPNRTSEWGFAQGDKALESFAAKQSLGRWPANITFDEEAAAILDAQVGDRPDMSGGGKHRPDYGGGMFGAIDAPHLARNDSGGPSRFFYVAKATSFERNFGCEDLRERGPEERVGRDPNSKGAQNPRAGAGGKAAAQNHHPTIKSISLTKWLATLIKPPGEGKRLLCPFAGSGGEVIGGMRAGWSHVEGIEQDPDFVEIARARVKRWSEVSMHLEPDEVNPTERVDERQPSLFSKAGNE